MAMFGPFFIPKLNTGSSFELMNFNREMGIEGYV